MPELDNTPAPEIDPAADASADVRGAIAQLKGETLPEPTPDPAAAPAADVQPPTADRPRNERGQFIKADGSVDPDQSPVKVPDADPAVANVPEPSKAPRQMPNYWSAEVKAEVTKLSPAAQEAVFKRLEETDKAGTQWSEEKKTLLGHFEPVRGISEKHKVHPGEVIKRLADANDFLERDAPSAIAWLAKAYNVDLSKLAANPPAASPPSQPQADPVVAQLQSKVSQFEQRFEAEEQSKINGTISAFASAPGHEHFETVKADVGYLLLAAAQSGKELTLDQAYEQAVWANADTRAKLIAAQTAPVDAKQREAAEKARRGALSAHGAPNGAVTPPKVVAPPETSVADDVRAAMEQLRH